ncbi:MAG TPA: hypothetical protein DCR55_05340 [Lentisphaeria bacterium]|nr:hypothetical protein [Lentisphaeria bacterium]
MDMPLYILPSSVRDRTPWALLIAAQPLSPKPSPRAIAYRTMGPLFLPIDREILPAVTETELAGLIPYPKACWHPAIGLIPIEHNDIHGLQDLVSISCKPKTEWFHAVAPESESVPLLAVQADPNEAVADSMTWLSENIANEKPEALPGKKTESKFGKMVRERAERGLGAMEQAMQTRAGRPDEGQGGSSSGVGKWMHGKLSHMREKMQMRRRVEIERLVSMLECDPDEGLKYAIPFSGGSSRGTSEPKANLSEQKPDFDLDRLGGGDAGDAWTIPLDLQHQLLQLYRQLANREIRMGRTRRAAYILAELAHDYAQAASILEAGKQYREAASLYRDHLERPFEAARCLVAGGYLSEAIPIYESDGKYAQAGDLYAQLGQKAQATNAYEQAVARELSQGNTVSAAHLYETKLQDQETALECLAAAWPKSRQAIPALRERIALLGRLGRHSQTFEIVGNIVLEASGHLRDADIAQMLADIASGYPGREVRELAADQARVLLSRYLGGSDLATVRLAVRTLRELAPEDTLLQRDATRHFERWRDKVAGTFTLQETVRTLASFNLSIEARWMAVQVAPTGFVAAGFSQGAPVIARCSWDGQEDILDFERVLSHRSRILVAVDGQNQMPTLVHFPDCATQTQAFGYGASRLADSVVVGPDWLPANVLGIAYDRNGLQWVLTTGPFGYAIAQYHDRVLKGVFDVSIGGASTLTRPAYGEPFIIVQDCAIIGVGRKLVLFRPGIGTDSISVNSSIRELRRGTHNDVVLVICRRGFSVIRLRAPGESPVVLLENEGVALAGAVSEYHYAVANQKTIDIYYRRQTKPAYSITLPQENALAVLPISRHELGVFFANGGVVRYQLPD